MDDHVETLTIPDELAEELADTWTRRADAVCAASDADIWAVVAEGDEALADLYQKVWRHVSPPLDGPSVLGKLILDAQSYRRDRARHARRKQAEVS